MTIQHLRSSTANKRPTAAAMSDGQLAVNTNATNPGLFFKDADGSIRKVGPVFIGSSAPNSSPASGGSTGHAVGEQWLDNTGGTYVLKIWDGTAWRSETGTFVDVSGDNMTGNLTLGTDKIVLNATIGAATFVSQVSTTDRFDSNRTTGTDNVFNGRLNNSVTSTIRANGSATFAGETVVNGGFISQSSGSTPAIYINNVASGSAVNTIQLKGDGSATFAGDITTTGWNNSSALGYRLDSGGALLLNQPGSGASISVRQNGSETASIKGNGSATFAGDVAFGTGAADSRITLGSHGTAGTNDSVHVRADSANLLFMSGSGGITKFEQNGTARFTITADGSAEFASQVSTSDRFDSNRTSGTDNVFNGRLNGSVTTTITANGSATFAGETIVNGGFISQSSGSTPAIYINNVASGSAVNTIQLKGDGSASFNSNVTSKATFLNELQSGYSATGSAYKVFFGSDTFVDILNNGSATFAGDITTTGWNNSSALGYRLDSGGALLLNQPGSGASISVRQNGSETASIKGNGSATFAGNVEIGSPDYTSNSGVGIEARADGLIRLQRASGSSSAVLQTWKGSLNTINVVVDGSATFGAFNTSSTTTHGVTIDQFANSHSGVRVQSTSTATTVGEFFAGYRGSSAVFQVTTGGSASFAGAVSKGSGSFRIDHPLKPETHQLVHSFVEGPQADNIYRGKVDLVDGTATVNIDTAAGMTEGTFAALNREVQCFTTNETGWTAIKGSVTDNLLTIVAQDNTCTDTISWLVIGERKDQHMYDTEWTDENGKVIVEPEKPTEEAE